MLVLNKHFLFISQLLIVFSLISLKDLSACAETRSITFKSGPLKKSKLVELKHLCDQKFLQGKYFSLFLDTQAQEFNEASAWYAKGAFVYHYLSQALDYFFALDPKLEQRLQDKFPIKIRIELTNLFDPQGKFAHKDYFKVYNDAITIPASTELNRKPEDWDIEIWFRPSKKVKVGKGNQMLAQQLRDPEFLKRTAEIGLDNYLMSIMDNLSSLGMSNLYQGLMVIGGGPVLLTGASYVLQRTKTRYFLDTAMIPGIIYHEFSHLILADYIELNKNPIVEGYANFFAGRGLGKKKWGHRPKKFSKDKGKKVKEGLIYSFAEESNPYSSFTYSLLWDVAELFDDAREGDRFVYQSRKFYQKSDYDKKDFMGKDNYKNPTIKYHLTKWLLQTVDSMKWTEAKKQSFKLKLKAVFIRRGL